MELYRGHIGGIVDHRQLRSGQILVRTCGKNADNVRDYHHYECGPASTDNLRSWLSTAQAAPDMTTAKSFRNKCAVLAPVASP
jgi:hypothetical protein